ncbi:hypothetical protein [Celeribacter sp.]|uniref:hypothetical protein n=1 Tax=Celeribacter sp. TaxID=1890673 RepID=UPI003A953906
MKYIVAFLLAATPLAADPPVIEAVEAARSGEAWRFDVTLSHPDTGWDHYADGWRVLAPDGTELVHRVLTHPHVDEQPFTRSLSSVEIPDGVIEVKIEARDTQEGWAGTYYPVQLPN